MARKKLLCVISRTIQYGRGDYSALTHPEVLKKFHEFLTSLIGTGISIYTDGSKGDVDSAVEAAVFSPELNLAIKYKLPLDS